MEDSSLMYGRSLLKEELDQTIRAVLMEQLNVKPAFQTVKGEKVCSRCSTVSKVSKPYPCTCGNLCVYCRECIALGKVRECSKLYSLKEPNLFKEHTKPYLKWDGSLTDQQKEASDIIVKSIEKNRETIIWAVAGAGKTEMLFRGFQYALENGKRVCIASPRIDVCLELAPRIQRVFPEVTVAVLYGGAEEKYTYTQLVIATTHQLYRFEEAFDVVIIDEVDAFPYHMNAALQFATEKARKKISSLIFLTATPDRQMQKKIRKNVIEAVILPARYHGYALPVPKAVYQKNDLLVDKHIRNTRVIRHMQRLVEQKKKFLLFIPTIILMEKLEPVFQTVFDKSTFDCVHSKDARRKEKVMKMRNGELDFLISTTILERGVTFVDSDVIIWQADHDVYTESALVQISGRAGRAKEFPIGNVTYYHQGFSRAMKKALRQIKRMNRLAKKRGLIQ